MRVFRFGGLVAGLGLLLAACGGGTAAPSSAASSPAAATSSAAGSVAAAVATSGSAAANGASASGGSSASAGASAGGSASASAGASAAGSLAPATSSTAPQQMTDVTLALGYIPNVQFAPFYVAQAKGFYKDEGINISFDNGQSPDLIKAVGAGKFNFAIADSDTVISAREQSIPVTYVAGMFAQTPNAIISLNKAGITQAAQLKGKKVGIPFKGGSSYIGLLGVLNKVGLTENDINLMEIGYNQAPQLLAGKVDAVVGFANNDALQIQSQDNGAPPNVIKFTDVIPFVGTGLITNETTLTKNPKLVQGMVRAMLRGMQYAAQNPSDAFEITTKVVPEAGGQNATLNKAVLTATLPLFKSAGTDQNGLGWTDPSAWQSEEDIMVKSGIVKTPPQLGQVVTNQFISKDLK